MEKKPNRGRFASPEREAGCRSNKPSPSTGSVVQPALRLRLPAGFPGLRLADPET